MRGGFRGILCRILCFLVLLAGACAGSSGDDPDAPPDAKDASDAPAAPDTAEPSDAVDAGSADGGTPDARASDVGSSDASSPTDAPRVEDVASPPFRPPAVCGAAPHEWLPADQVGEVVAFGQLPLFHRITGPQLDVLLAQVGYERVSPVPYGVRIYFLRYVTQDRGELREATAAVGIPEGVDPATELPVALWLHHSVGFVDACAPLADPVFAPVAPAVMASQGYLAIAPDFLGLMGMGEPSPPGSFHPYLVAEPTAIASLDAVRAALRAVTDRGLATGDPGRVVLIGGSQGGHAAFAVDRYAPHYAPELGILAAAAAVPPTDLRSIARRAATDWGAASRTLPAAFVAMGKWYGGADGGAVELTGVLTNDEPFLFATTVEERYRADCGFDLRVDGLDALEDLYTPDFLAAAQAGDWESVAPWGCYLAQNSPSFSAVPYASDTPFLAVYAENDELVFAEEQKEDVERLCDMGYRIEHVECGGLTHTPGGRATAPLMLDWLARRVAGEPWPEEKVCVLTAPVDCEALP